MDFQCVFCYKLVKYCIPSRLAKHLSGRTHQLITKLSDFQCPICSMTLLQCRIDDAFVHVETHIAKRRNTLSNFKNCIIINIYNFIKVGAHEHAENSENINPNGSDTEEDWATSNEFQVDRFESADFNEMDYDSCISILILPHLLSNTFV